VPQGTPEIVSKLADRGEEALQKIAATQAGQKVLEATSSLREYVDELHKRVNGVEALEKRVVELEERVRTLDAELRKHGLAPAETPQAKPATEQPLESAS
jgi:DNA repair ATPase RecN